MSVSGGAEPVAAAATRLQWAGANCARYFALLIRRPKLAGAASRRRPLRLAGGVVALVAGLAVIMIAVDAWAIGLVPGIPERLIAAFDRATDLGKSVWVLVPVALLLAAIALRGSPTLPRVSRIVLTAAAVRLGFLFLAIGLPGLVFVAVKRLVGRARPLVEGAADPFIYRPLGWNVEYASLPSGHAIDAFAIAMAAGALWPRARALLWTYAVVIAVSRVVLLAHFPSDVVAGAVVGVFGAMLVREWFAARGLAFVPDGEGGIRPLPGPSFARIKRVARLLIAS